MKKFLGVLLTIAIAFTLTMAPAGCSKDTKAKDKDAVVKDKDAAVKDKDAAKDKDAGKDKKPTS